MSNILPIGYDCSDTIIFFPLNKKFVLVGDFEEKYNGDGNKKIKEEGVAYINSEIIRKSYGICSIFAASDKFKFLYFNDGSVLHGEKLLYSLKKMKEIFSSSH